MIRTLTVAAFAFVAFTPVARAQIVVIDPANLTQTVMIAERTWQHYQELQRQYSTILRMSRNLGNMEGYRIPTIPIASHDPTRWEFGRAGSGAEQWRSHGCWLSRHGRAADATDDHAGRLSRRRGACSNASTPLLRLPTRWLHWRATSCPDARVFGPPAGRRAGPRRDVLNGLLRYHEMTAILDKIAAGELLGRRQDMAANQLLSHALEQLLARSKRQRDTEAATMNMQLTSWRDGRAANEAFVAGTGDALRTWRQP